MAASSFLENLSTDIRIGVRSLLKSPGFLAIVILSLGLGIAANSTIFSVLDTFLYRPLPFPNPDRLAVIWETPEGHPENFQPPPIAESVDWQKQNHVFEDIALISFNDSTTISGLGDPETVRVQYVTPNLFALLGARPVLGRVFRAEEAQDLSETVVISSTYWKRKFNSDPDVLGRAFHEAGKQSTIVGVMQPGFTPFYGQPVDMWIPIDASSTRYALRMDHWLMPVGRLKKGVTIEQAQTEMDLIAKRLETEYPKTNKGVGKKVFPLHDDLFRGAGAALYPLFGAVGFVLLIACVNVANLIQFRMETRRKEYVLRSSFGAPRGRLIQQLFVESSLLAFAGGVVGILLTFVGIALFRYFAGNDLPNVDDIRIDSLVFLFTIGISVLTAILVGLVPSIRSSQPDLNMALRENERGSTSSRRWGRHALVVSEVALAMILLVGAGLMINTILHLQSVNPGLDAHNVIAMRIPLPEGGKYVHRVPGTDTEEPLPAVTSFYKQVLEKVDALPGVQSAGIVSWMPLRGLDYFTFSIVGKQAPAPDQRPATGADEVSASFFDTLKIPLKKGRYLNDHDDAAAPWAVVINETFAQQYFPNEDPIGKQILLRFDPYPVDDDHPREIVGVVGNVKHFGLGRPDRPFVYTSFLQQPAAFPGGRTISHIQQELLVRTAPGLASAGSGFALTVRKAVAEVDPDQAVTDTTTMDKVVAESIGDAQFYAQLIGIFAFMAVLLAAIGIYGVISYSVTERTQEIGIRVALGAQSASILVMVTKLGLMLVGLGVIVGGAAAMGLARLISIFLFGVKPSDPLTYILVASALIAVALLACYVPARRASKVDPMVALRYQ